MGGFLAPLQSALQNSQNLSNQRTITGMQEAGATQRQQSMLAQQHLENAQAAWLARQQHLHDTVANAYSAENDPTTRARLANLQLKIASVKRPDTNIDADKDFGDFENEFMQIQRDKEMGQQHANNVAAQAQFARTPQPAAPGPQAGTAPGQAPMVRPIDQFGIPIMGLGTPQASAAAPPLSPVQPPAQGGGGISLGAPFQRAATTGTAQPVSPIEGAAQETQAVQPIGTQPQNPTAKPKFDTSGLQNEISSIRDELYKGYLPDDMQKALTERYNKLQGLYGIVNSPVWESMTPLQQAIYWSEGHGMQAPAALGSLSIAHPLARGVSNADILAGNPYAKDTRGAPLDPKGRSDIRFQGGVEIYEPSQHRIIRVPGADKKWHEYDQDSLKDLGALPGSTVTALDPLFRSATQYLGTDGQLHTISESQRSTGDLGGGSQPPSPISPKAPLTTPSKSTAGGPASSGKINIMPLAGAHTIADVPAAIRPQVEQIVGYQRADPPPGRDDLTTRAIMNWVMALDPGHDASDFQAKNAMVRSYTSGPFSKQINAANVAVNHLLALQEAGKALDSGQLPILNKIANSLKLGTGQSAPAVYNSIVQAVAPELAKAYGQDTGEERIALQNSLGAQASPAQRNDVINARAQLIRSSLQPLENQWNTTVRGSGANSFDQRFMSGNRAILDRMADAAGLNPVGATTRKTGQLTLEEAKSYLQRAGGDKDKARAMAKKDGRTF